ncbi:hypothetical protein [Streptomyces sp. S186]|uniref:hypothetical protein n=1 Tax=Streptomyces sp. S186 TaxID=3434395 RepID=UPI003F6688C9
MRAQRRSVIRTATVAAGALAVLLLPTGAAFAADSTGPTGRTSVILPDEGLLGLAEKAGHLPKAGVIGGATALGAVGVGVAVQRRRHTSTDRTR